MRADETLVRLVRQGRKVDCPVCGRRAMSEAYKPFTGSGIGQHIRAVHPELEPEVLAASKREESRIAALERATTKEARERPSREHTVTGAFLSEVAAELSGLIDMLEPYYAQSNAADNAHELIARIEAMHTARASQ